MKNLLILINLFLIITIRAQTPQITLVKPDGTTTLHVTFQEACDNATNDDSIYFPGGIFSISGNSISKKLNIYGAGSMIDSSHYTGFTSLQGDMNFTVGSSGSKLEGIYLSSVLYLGDNNLTIRRCILRKGIYVTDTITNVSIINNLLSGNNINSGSANWSINGMGNSLQNSIITNNLIYDQLRSGSNNTFNNNIFFFYIAFQSLSLHSYSYYNNNIFKGGAVSVSNSIFYNNVNVDASSSSGNQDYNIVNESFPEIFVDPENDYHILPTSQCHNSGTDGTDRGIYGGTYPWVEGMVPSNPHIFFKNIPGVTNANGNLPINVKVKAQNN